MSDRSSSRPRGFGHGGGRPVYVPTGEKYEFSSTWGKIISYCRPYFPAIIIALICAVSATVLTLLGPDKLSELTNTITKGFMTGIDMDAVSKIAFTLVAFYGASFLVSYIQSFLMSTVTQRVSKNLRSDISKKVNKLPLRYFDKTSYGDILSRVTNDVDTIGQTLNQSIGGLVSAAAQLIGSVVMMLSSNWIMAITAMLSSVLGFVLMTLIISRSQKYFISQQKLLGDINGHIEEVYSGHNVIKAYNAEDELHDEFRGINKAFYNTSWKAQFFSGLMMPLMSFIGNFGYVAVCVVGAVLTKNEIISFGDIVAFTVYVRLFTQPLTQIAQSATSLQSTNAASFRVFEFLGEKELENEGDKTEFLETARGDIEFQNISFGYTEDKTIIHDFSAKIKAGQKIAIVGPTGAGKTTMVNLLMRFYETNSGKILIDGIPTSSITRENLHDLFCMVLQDTWLFEGTIRENIAYCKEDATDEEIIRACKASGIHHFIKTLPKGYDTVLNEEAGLSAGQKQLITIARAMIENAPMLILDEATSSVDTRTEVLIQEAMDKLMEGRTSIVIAHRLSTIKNASLILVMKDGDIIESGTHAELLEQNGFYAELYNSQFEKVS
ncbi:ABC transporter ATP-binding protein/permease [Clostridiaceae bacterium OttesenSCG-928-D20]|nr:ABC transporter ATP-binding protein/permease [Clostridiaceae bacterium OttesenSCG-928-D20]